MTGERVKWRNAASFNVNEKDRAWVDELSVPQPIGAMLETLALTGARDRIANKAYIRGTGYPSVPFDAACARATAEGWRTYDVPCGHNVMIDRPERLAEILNEVA